MMLWWLEFTGGLDSACMGNKDVKSKSMSNVIRRRNGEVHLHVAVQSNILRSDAVQNIE